VKPADGFRHELRSRILPGLASRSLIDLTAQESRLASLPADPGEMTVHFNLNDTPLATLPWIGAAVVLTPEDQTAITDLVLAMQAAFVARDTTALADLQNLRIERFATARGQTVAQFRSDLIDSYQPLFADPAFVFEPFDAAALTLVSQPGVNLVQVLRDGSPPIKATGQTGGLSATFKVPVFVSKIAGSWKIVD